MDYKAEAERTYEVVMKALESDDWGKEVKSSKDNKVYRKKSEQFSGYVYKALYTVEMSLADYLAVVSPKCLGGYLEDIDSLIKEIQCLEDVSDDIKVIRSVSNPLARGLISSREFIDILYIKRFADNEKKCAVLVMEAEHDIPVAPKLVRGKRHPTGMLINVVQQGDKEILEIKHIEQLDFCGMVPSSVISSFIPSELANRSSMLQKNLKKLEKIRGK